MISISDPLQTPLPPPSSCRTPRPADFDSFWQETLETLAEVPLDVRLEQNRLRSTPTVDVYDVHYRSWGGLEVFAWYCVPAGAAAAQQADLPGLILPPGYIGDPVIPKRWAELGYAAIAPAPRGKVRSRDLCNPGYPGLLTSNLTDRSTYTYRGFYLDVLRCLDVLQSRPEVDRARVGVHGASQGGALAIIVPALAPEAVCCASSGVPYLADQLGAIELTRTYPYQELADYLRLYPERREAVEQTLAYFDVRHFGPRVTCPIIVSLGLQDNIVPPETCRVAFDSLTSAADRTLYCYERCGHDGGTALGHGETVDQFLASHLGPVPASAG
ncbi:MAG: acetylxylan esterase [Planctomycetaceae bacterium]|nr:acetylxylan esterase [Planctomycetaceae bacterium]